MPRDGARVLDPARRLAEGDHAVLRQRVERGRILGLGEHDGAERARAERIEVEGELDGLRRVDPHDRAIGVEVGTGQVGAGGGLVSRGDGVFEVEDDAVGGRRRLAVAVGTVGGAEQEGGPGDHDAPPGAGSAGAQRMSVERLAVATTVPCWLRAVCANSTMPCPGRDDESRFDTTSVSP